MPFPSAVIDALTNLSLPGNPRGKRQSAAATSLDDAETSRTAVRESGGQMCSTLPHRPKSMDSRLTSRSAVERRLAGMTTFEGLAVKCHSRARLLIALMPSSSTPPKPDRLPRQPSMSLPSWLTARVWRRSRNVERLAAIYAKRQPPAHLRHSNSSASPAKLTTAGTQIDRHRQCTAHRRQRCARCSATRYDVSYVGKT